MLRTTGLIALSLLLAAPLGAATPEESCAAAKNKAAGAYSACRQKAEAKAIQKGTEPSYGKCDARFESGWNKAEAKAAKKGATCVDGAETEGLRQLVADSSDAVATILSGLAPQCLGAYLTLDRANRNVAASEAPFLCDDFSGNTSPQWQGSGWYRFDGAAGTRMPESAPPAGACSTGLRGWMNGTHPEASEGVVTRDLCWAAGDDCSGLFADALEVVNCGGFFLYNLPHIGACDYRYCAE